MQVQTQAGSKLTLTRTFMTSLAPAQPRHAPAPFIEAMTGTSVEATDCQLRLPDVVWHPEASCACVQMAGKPANRASHACTLLLSLPVLLLLLLLLQGSSLHHLTLPWP